MWYFWKQCIHGGEDTLWCWTGEGDWTGLVRYFSIGTYARLTIIGVSVPLAMLFVGHVFAWIVRGFLPPRNKA